MRSRIVAATGALVVALALAAPTAALAAEPTVGITITETSLAIGDTATVEFTFSEPVSGFTLADTTVANASLSGLSSADGGLTWTATLTPSWGVQEATNVLTVDLTGVANAGAEAGSGIATSPIYAIDTVRPMLASSIAISDTALAAGQSATVTFTFNEPVTGFDIADVAAPNATLAGLSTSDNIVWAATLTPAAGVQSSGNVLTLDYTSLTDAAGNGGTGSVTSGSYRVDTTRPTASLVVADPALAAGETSLVTVTFSEPVSGFTVADLTAGNGSLTALSSADGGVTWTSTFTPNADVAAPSNTITLDASGVADLAGNPGVGVATSNAFAIDTARPTATLVVADTALTVGETTPVTITFSEAVTGFSNLDLTTANGTLSPVSSTDGGITWTATFTPNADVTAASNTIALDLSGVADAAGNLGAGSATSNAFAIDTTIPVVVVPPAPVTPTPTTPTAPVTPVVAAPPATPVAVAADRMPVTGAAVDGLLLAGSTLAAAGLVLFVASRRRLRA